MTENAQRRTARQWLYIVAVVLSSGVCAGMWLALFVVEPQTDARRVIWHNPDGTTVDKRLEPCANTTLESIVHDGAVWMPCDEKDYFGSGTGLARVDPGAGKATLLPWPEEFPHHHNTQGAAAGPDGELCYAYHTGDNPRKLVVGVAKGTEWLAPVRKLSTVELLGMDWQAASCEVVGIAEGGLPRIDQVTPDGVHSRPFTPNWDEFCGAQDYCQPLFAFRDHDDQWVLAYQQALQDGGVRYLRVQPGQPPRPYDTRPSARSISLSLDTLAYELGKISSPHRALTQVRADGRRVARAELPGDPPSFEWAHYDFSKERVLTRRYSWQVSQATRYHLRHRVRGRVLQIHGADLDDPLLTVSDITDPDDVRSAVVGRIPGYACGYQLTTGTFLTRPEGGYWLVGASGCYITMDENFRRMDPLPLLTHLRTRGSREVGPFVDREYQHEYWLGWTLFGILPCFLVSWAVRRRRRFWAAVGPGAVLFAGTGIWGVWSVLPLLF